MVHIYESCHADGKDIETMIYFPTIVIFIIGPEYINNNIIIIYILINDRHHSTFDSKQAKEYGCRGYSDIVLWYIVSLSEKKCFEFTLKDNNVIAT